MRLCKKFLGLFLPLALIVVFPYCFSASADSDHADQLAPAHALRQGMTTRDVFILLGEPRERLEFETKREHLWIYPDFRVRFKDGFVTVSQPAVKSASLDTAPIAADDTPKNGDQAAARKPERRASSAAVEDILNEIMRTTGDQKQPAAGGSPAAPPAPPPAMLAPYKMPE